MNDDLLARATDELARRGPPPPPPPFATRVAPALDSVRRRSPGRGVGRTLAFASAAIAATLLLAVGFGLVRRPGQPGAPDGVVATVARGRDALRVNGTIAPSTLRAGDVLDASDDAELSIGAGTRLVVARGARLAFESRDRLLVERGVVDLELGARPSPLVVEAVGVRITDLGTAYRVEADPDAAVADPRVAELYVTVREGAVDAGGVRVDAGTTLAFRGGRPTGPPVPIDAKPILGLEAGEGGVVGAPVEVRLVLANPTDRTLRFPDLEPATAPIHIEVTDPEGRVAWVRVTSAMVPEPPVNRGIPPRGRTVLPIRFDRTFASEGTYRLRALFRPAQAVESPTSAPVTVRIRASGGPR